MDATGTKQVFQGRTTQSIWKLHNLDFPKNELSNHDIETIIPYLGKYLKKLILIKTSSRFPGLI